MHTSTRPDAPPSAPPAPVILGASEKLASGPQTTSTEPNVWQTNTLTQEPRWGNDYMHARYYNPQIARFLSVDPVGGSIGSSQSWNRYSYVRNNPVGLVDPDGRQTVPEHQSPPTRVPSKGDLWRELNRRAAGLIYNEGEVWLIEGDSAPPQITEEQLAQAAVLAEALGLAADALQPAPSDMPEDKPTENTNNWSATMNSEGEARALAREKLGTDPVVYDEHKMRSQDGKWQYRAKPGDVEDNHIHLEELDPETGEVLQNVHLRWPEGTERAQRED